MAADEHMPVADQFGEISPRVCPGTMLTVERVVAAPPAVVWDVLVDIEAWPEWGPSISGAHVESGDGRLVQGSVGYVSTSIGVVLPFVITEFEPGSHWAWKVAGVSATRHHLKPVGAGSRVIFEVPWWAPAYLAVCAIALRRIENIVAR
jgi:uncharacterized protein YndB with AHSA1/START domain